MRQSGFRVLRQTRPAAPDEEGDDAKQAELGEFHEGHDDVSHGRLKRRDMQRGHRTAGCNNIPWLAGTPRCRRRHKLFKLLTHIPFLS